MVHQPKKSNSSHDPVSTLPGQNRLLAAASGLFDIPRTKTVFGETTPGQELFWERAFSMAGPCEWITLSLKITDIANKKLLNEF